MVKFGGITSGFQWYTTGLSVVSSGITSGILVVAIGIPVVSSCKIWCCYTVVLPEKISDKIW